MRVRPGEAGHAIIQHARDIAAEAIVMPLTVGSRDPISRTHQQVLAERPCRVIIATERDAVPSNGTA
jgi:hypothetical protein